MFDGRAVVIVGAGASCDFGLPTGAELYGHILKDACRCVADYESREFGPVEFARLEGHGAFWEKPLPYLLNTELHARHGGPLQFGDGYKKALGGKVARIRKLIGTLETSTAETIDEFLTLNPSHVDLCRLLLAQRFYRLTHEHRNAALHPKSYVSRFAASGERNWIHLFINAFKTNFVRGRRPAGIIDIISFNYDPILKRVLTECFDGSENSIGPWTNYFRLFQPYGCFDLPDAPSSPEKTIRSWASCLKVIGRDVVCDSAVQLSVGQADYIYAAGFNFARDNCKLIELERRNQMIFYVNYDGNPGLDDRVSRYSDVAKPFRGTQSEGMTVARAIGLGLVGELPA